MSPGREAVTTLSGTRESAHPIQRTYITNINISNLHLTCKNVEFKGNESLQGRVLSLRNVSAPVGSLRIGVTDCVTAVTWCLLKVKKWLQLAYLWGLALSTVLKEWRLDFINVCGPLGVGREQTGEGREVSGDHG